MGKRIKVTASKEEADFSSMRCSLEKMFQEEMLHLSYATNTTPCHDFQDLWRKQLYLVCLNLEPCCCWLSSEDFESEKQGKESICYILSVSVQREAVWKSHHCPYLAWTLGHGKKQQSHSDTGVLSKCCFCSCAGMHHVFICVQKSNVVTVCSTATAVIVFALFNV